jgi:hypothetical protein
MCFSLWWMKNNWSTLKIKHLRYIAGAFLFPYILSMHIEALPLHVEALPLHVEALPLHVEALLLSLKALLLPFRQKNA